MVFHGRGWPIALTGGLLIACGLRSNPTDVGLAGETRADDGTTADDTVTASDTATITTTGDESSRGEDTSGDDGPLGCAGAIWLPYAEFQTIGGTLSGSGLLSGWCGNDNGDEDVYVMTAHEDRDLIVRPRPGETDFSPTIRIERGTCGSATVEDTPLCATGVGERHTLTVAPYDYYITVDSAGGSGGAYVIDLLWVPPDISACNPHKEVIVQSPGGVFQWYNDLPDGQGVVDGRCGGPGHENMFRLDTYYSGYLWVEAFTSFGFDPVVGLRTDCGGTSELYCSFEPQSDSNYASLPQIWVDGGRTYWVTVDQRGVKGGHYELFVWFD